jgi:predicted MPP superfamily phosphohydrolase
MRYLILPDVHDKIRRANQIIEREPHDHLLLMGDFFDDFRTGVTDAADTARQVKRWLNAPNTTCLLGNHDMSYGWGRQNRRLICPGYDAAKWITIHGTLMARDWQKFRLHAWLDGDERPWLVSHRRTSSMLAGRRRAQQVPRVHRQALRRCLGLPEPWGAPLPSRSGPQPFRRSKDRRDQLARLG